MQRHWISAALKVNWANMVTNKGAFYSMLLFVCPQNLIYFSLWVIIFSKISSMRGWGLSEVAFLYASASMGYGILFAFFGGLNQLGHAIQSGELDVHLGRPRSSLLLAMMQRMRGDSLGDILTGCVMLILFVRPPIESWPLLAVLTISAGIVFFAIRLITHSLAFWNLSGDAAEDGFISFLIAATNPHNGFNPYMKLALLTIFPAGYVGLLPVEILRDFRWDYLALQLTGSFTLLMFSLWLFHRGLKRYRSGNKFLVLR